MGTDMSTSDHLLSSIISRSWVKGKLCSNSRSEFTELLFIVDEKGNGGNGGTTGPFSGRLGEPVAAFPSAIR